MEGGAGSHTQHQRESRHHHDAMMDDTAVPREERGGDNRRVNDYPYDSNSDLPACLKGHKSAADLFEATKQFGEAHGFGVLAKGIKYFDDGGDGAVDAQGAAETLAGSSERGPIDLGRIKVGVIQCKHYGTKRKWAPRVSPTRQRSKPSTKLGCNFHINFQVAKPGLCTLLHVVINCVYYY